MLILFDYLKHNLHFLRFIWIAFSTETAFIVAEQLFRPQHFEWE